MKKVLTMILLLLLALSAHGETLYGREGDCCYHIIPDCAGDSFQEISDTEGLYRCPVCVPDPVDYGGLRYFNVGGLTVIRMSDEFIKTRDDVGSVFGFSGTDEYTGLQAEAQVARVLHGADYIAFKAQVRETGAATAPATGAFSLVSSGEELYTPFLSRHLGGAWVEVLPPFGAMANGELNPRFFTGEMTWKDGVLTVEQPDEWDAYDSHPDITDLSGLEPAWTAAEDSWRLSLYEAEDMRILTLRITGKDAVLAPEASISCPGWPGSLDIKEPWRDGGDCLYGVALFEGEAGALKANEPTVEYSRFGDMELDYQDSPFAIGETENGQMFVLDRDMNVVVQPESGMMYRVGDVFLYGDWAFVGTGDTWRVYDADHDAVLMEATDCVLGLNAHRDSIEMPDYNEVRIHAEGDDEPLAVLPGRDGYEVTGVTLRGDPDVYTLNYSAAVAEWINGDHQRAPVPEGILVLIIHVDNSRPAEDGPDCAAIIWNLSGGEKPTPEALGMTFLQK